MDIKSSHNYDKKNFIYDDLLSLSHEGTYSNNKQKTSMNKFNSDKNNPILINEQDQAKDNTGISTQSQNLFENAESVIELEKFNLSGSTSLGDQRDLAFLFDDNRRKPEAVEDNNNMGINVNLQQSNQFNDALDPSLSKLLEPFISQQNQKVSSSLYYNMGQSSLDYFDKNTLQDSENTIETNMTFHDSSNCSSPMSFQQNSIPALPSGTVPSNLLSNETGIDLTSYSSPDYQNQGIDTGFSDVLNQKDQFDISFQSSSNQQDSASSPSMPVLEQRPTSGYISNTTTNNAVPDKNFQCPQCPLSFRRNHDLKRHLKIHLPVRPYICSLCSKAFNRKDALRRHVISNACRMSPARQASAISGTSSANSTNNTNNANTNNNSNNNNSSRASSSTVNRSSQSSSSSSAPSSKYNSPNFPPVQEYFHTPVSPAQASNSTGERSESSSYATSPVMASVNTHIKQSSQSSSLSKVKSNISSSSTAKIAPNPASKQITKARPKRTAIKQEKSAAKLPSPALEPTEQQRQPWEISLLQFIDELIEKNKNRQKEKSNESQK